MESASDLYTKHTKISAYKKKKKKTRITLSRYISKYNQPVCHSIEQTISAVLKSFINKPFTYRGENNGTTMTTTTPPPPPPPPQSYSQTIEVQSDVKLHVITAGGQNDSHDRPTLVFLHFWGGSVHTWTRVIPLVSSQYSTVAIDFRGWGESIGPLDAASYSISQLADDTESIVNILRLEKVILVGLSMGAKVAQAIAGRGSLTGRLKGLVLVSPSPPTPLLMPPEASEQQIHAYDNWQNAEYVAKNVLVSAPDALDDKILKQVVGDMLRGNQYARAAWPSYAMGQDIQHLATKIKVPVLVLAAAKDVVEPLQRVEREVCGVIPGAELVVISNSGHLSPLEAPEQVAENILKFLSMEL